MDRNKEGGEQIKLPMKRDIKLARKLGLYEDQIKKHHGENHL